MRIAAPRTLLDTLRRRGHEVIPLGLLGWITTITLITTATCTKTRAAVGTSTTTAIGTAFRTAPGRSLSIMTRLLGLRATSALRRHPGGHVAGAAASVDLTGVGVAGPVEVCSAVEVFLTEEAEVEVFLAVVVGIVVAVVSVEVGLAVVEEAGVEEALVDLVVEAASVVFAADDNAAGSR